MLEKCPRCNSFEWELNDKNKTCYCKKCHGFFGQEDVIEFWNEGAKTLGALETFAETGGTRKPKAIFDKYGQFQFRCPICGEKHLDRGMANQCINSCWEKVKVLRKNS